MIYPEYDRKLRAVEGQVADLAHAVAMCRRRRVAIQAGGAVGVWPEYLARNFESVYTFEPDAQNYAALCDNVTAENVYSYFGALDYQKGDVAIRRDDFERDNAGAGYTVPGGDVPAYALDDMFTGNVDLIQLDIEGNEWRAICGAVRLILNCRPVIMLEEKALPHTRHHETARKILELFGYKVRKRINRDVILTC